jgi:putative ABC transport system permease protein
MLTPIARDLVHAIRLLRRQPAFSALLIATLALGIGGATTIFSAVEAVLLRPLPYTDEDRIVMVWETEPAEGVAKKVGTPGNFPDWQTSATIDHLAGLAQYQATMTGRGNPMGVNGRRVSASLFAALGVLPVLGRGFTTGDEQSGGGVVILAHHFWRQAFGADPGVIGQSITLNDSPRTVVGVMPAGFRLPRAEDDVLVPLVFNAWERQARGSHWLMAVGRLKPGVALAAAQADMDVIAARLRAEHPRFNAREGLLVEHIREEMVGELRRPLLVLMGAVLIVLGIASINAANLLLARAETRRQEVAVRLALGAGRLTIVRQLLVESVTGSMAGAAGGVMLAWMGVRSLAAMMPEDLAPVRELSINATVLTFAVAAATITGVLFGLAPSLQVVRRRFAVGPDHGRPASSARATRAGRILVTVEVALALVLLVGAALFMQSLARLMRVEPGFQTSSVLTFRIELPRSRYPDPAKWSPFLGELMARLASEPGVLGAGAISWLPLTTDGGSNALFVEGRPLPAPGAETYVIYRLVTAGYFEALAIPRLSGRGLTAADGAGSARVVVINETMARRYWPGESPIGRRVSFAAKAGPDDWMTVVGVVGDTKQGSLAAPVDIEMFAPEAQEPNWFPPSHVVVRTAASPLSMAEAARRHVREIDPLMPVADVQTMERVLSASVSAPRFEAVLIGLFGAVAASLAAIGVYGVMSLSVALRRRELGIRTALGAGPQDISRLVLGEGARMAGAGIAIGLVAAFVAGRWIQALLFDTPPADPSTAAATAALLLAITLAACYIPARRAARADPVRAMQ